MKVSTVSVPRGSILVLTDVPLEHEQMMAFRQAVIDAAGHHEFCILQVWTEQPVTLFSIENVLESLAAQLKEDDGQPAHAQPQHP
jgi:hypothetical protein